MELRGLEPLTPWSGSARPTNLPVSRQFSVVGLLTWADAIGRSTSVARSYATPRLNSDCRRASGVPKWGLSGDARCGRIFLPTTQHELPGGSLGRRLHRDGAPPHFWAGSDAGLRTCRGTGDRAGGLGGRARRPEPPRRVRRLRSEADRAAAYPAWLHHYNHHRGHTSLRGKSPIDRVPNLPGQKARPQRWSDLLEAPSARFQQHRRMR